MKLQATPLTKEAARPLGAVPLKEFTDNELMTRFEALEAQQAQDDLHFFLRKVWPLVEPTKKFVDNWHIRRICRDLEAVTKGEHRRVVINMPPGTLKSILLVVWRAWEWANNPMLRYLTASYATSLTIRDNLRLRQIITSVWYQRYFGEVRLKSDQNAKERFDTTQEGWCIATSVCGPGTGEHPDRVIIDDPLTATQALSAIERQAANDWFDNTVAPRGIARDVVILIVMQRLHEDDLTGHVLAKNPGGWYHIKLPMRYEPYRPKTERDEGNIPDPEDPRMKAGELLIPQLIDEAKVRQLEMDLGPFGTAGQLQQRPSEEGGGFFKREWLPVVDIMPANVKRRARGWDTGGTEGDGDPTVGVRIAEVEVVPPSRQAPGQYHYYIEDVVWEQTASPDRLMKETATADGRLVDQREEKEPGSAGVAVIRSRQNLLRGYSYEGVVITGDKVTRAKPFRSQSEAGNVFLVRGPWNQRYIQELTHFPNGTHDDQVDASSCAFNAIILEKANRKRGGAFGRRTA